MPKIKCVHCGKEFEYKDIKEKPSFPFCSKKCKMIDLGIWFNEGHSIQSPLNSQIDNTFDD